MSGSVRTLAAVAGLGLTGYGGYRYANLSSNNKTGEPTTVITEKPLKHYDSRPFQLLSKEDIDQRLRANQFINRSSIKNVKSIHVNQVASNNPVEDNYSVNTFQNGLIAGVYDGHIGPHCSRMIKTQLPIYMARELGTNSKDTEKSISTAFELLDDDIQQRFYALFPKNLKHTTEKDIQKAIASQPDQEEATAIMNEAINGSCACTVYVKDGVVYSANTGDSRVVIVSQDDDGNWKGRRLVEEESPADPEWRKHMISQHPANEADVIVMRNRIFGLIAVGGSFGDIMYKVPREYQIKVLPFIPYDIYKTFARYHHRIVVHYNTPPYLQSKPLVSAHKLEKNDRYVVIGTDGLWDELSWDNVRSTDGDQMAATIASQFKKDNREENNLATHFIRESLLYQAVYKNVRVDEDVEDPVLELSKRLTRKPSRNYRDDITVVVLELGENEAEENEKVIENTGPIVEIEEINASVPRLPIPKSTQSWFSGWIWSRL
ncbi:protein serine/threonine phosphatase 2C [Backusella circina FSU 941]|nr:protein serine/threonine phosphatase 2C [Backusella circina FSU 941]